MKFTLTSNVAMAMIVLVVAEQIYDKFITSPKSTMSKNPTHVLYNKDGNDASKKQYWNHHYMDGNLDGVITTGEAQREHDFTWIAMDKTRPIYELLNSCSQEDKDLIYGLTYSVAVQAVKLNSSEKKYLLNLDLISRVNNLNSRFSS
jgi:hypothetical protein